ncbi:MAG TPA: hypothetical protein VFS08_00875 [Gemmatimonadaceae bacterium]|nr:hypothetical protein [Gemmatimonadaceae bacterium]
MTHAVPPLPPLPPRPSGPRHSSLGVRVDAAAGVAPPWRFEIDDATTPPPEPPPAPRDLAHGWRQLQLLHTPFRATGRAEYTSLLASYGELERLFLGDDRLRAHYEECWTPLTDPPPASGTDIAGDGAAGPLVRHAVALQARLMEDVYYVLQLGHYANALDNRGWMNLFRRWARSPAFNRWFDTLRELLTLELVEFYDHYLRGDPRPIEASPVPHPWDVARPLPDAEAVMRAAERPARLHGIFLDSGLREAAPPHLRSQPEAPPPPRPGADQGLDGPGVGEQGIPDPKGGTQPYEQPPSSGGDAPAAPGGPAAE